MRKVDASIQLNSGRKPIPCDTLVATGLVVHRAWDRYRGAWGGGWTVTHLHTGVCCTCAKVRPKRKADAIRRALLLATVLDFDQMELGYIDLDTRKRLIAEFNKGA